MTLPIYCLGQEMSFWGLHFGLSKDSTNLIALNKHGYALAEGIGETGTYLYCEDCDYGGYNAEIIRLDFLDSTYGEYSGLYSMRIMLKPIKNQSKLDEAKFKIILNLEYIYGVPDIDNSSISEGIYEKKWKKFNSLVGILVAPKKKIAIDYINYYRHTAYIRREIKNNLNKY